jgi:hypothetical protein
MAAFLTIGIAPLIAIFCTTFKPIKKQRFFWGSLFVISLNHTAMTKHYSYC